MTTEQIEKAAQDYAGKHFIQDSIMFLNEPLDKAKNLYTKTLADFAKWCIKNQWVSVDERLPESDGFVMVFVSANPTFGMPDRHEIAYYDGEDWHTQDGEHIRPMHWMEIPKLNPEK